MSHPSTRRAGRNRHDILVAANHVMAERGYELTRFADVAQSSGTSISTLQYLFGSREDLLIASLRQRANDFLTSVRAVAETHHDPLDRLRAVVGEMLSVGYPLEEARRDWAVWVEYWRAASRDDELQGESTQTYSEWRSILASAIRKCAAEEDPPLTLDVNAVATGAMSMIDGFGIQIVLDRTRDCRPAALRTVLGYLASVLSLPALSTR